MVRIFYFGFVFSFLALSAWADRPEIKPSDVVFMYSASDPAQYDRYKGTIVGWGGCTRSRDEQSVERWKNRVNEAHKRGMQYCGSIDFLVDVRGFIDFAPDSFMDAVCVNLDGKPLRVPWLWDHEYKGHPFYWFCFNNPEYQKYLRDQVERVCLAPVDGLHIDDYAGTSHCSTFNHGCFCPHCMTGFRDYLKTNFSKRELKERGIASLDDFNYKTFLKDKDVKAEQFSTNNRDIPLAREFQDFQNGRMKERIREMYTYAERLRDKLLLRSVNSHASSIRTLVPAPILDYFCGEVRQMGREERIAADPIFVYRLVEAVGDRQTATASGQNWAWIKANDKPGLVRQWIAQTYAFGSVFMVPHRQWCYTQELGTHWYRGDPKDYAYLYRFVREHAFLFDETRALANTVLLMTNQDFHAMKQAALRMIKSNIPFVIHYEAEPGGISDAMLKKMEPYDYVLSGREWELPSSVTKWKQWESADALPLAVKHGVQVEGSEHVVVSLREKADRVICHVLNQNHDLGEDKVKKVSCTVAIREELLGREIQSAILYRAGKKQKKLSLRREKGKLSIPLNDLGMWGVVELK